jgi:prepilin-type N-terminal cleavage/methylation domain-containing protein
MINRERQAGFSLVELAIVLLIIGLIVGGVLKGQDLIRSARVNDVQTTVNQVRAATNTFQDKYVALPGDMAEASFLKDDWRDGSSQQGGDGNGRIGSTGDDNWRNGEAAKFWAHLAAAGLLSGVDAEAVVDGLGNNGEDGLEAAVGGYFKMSYATPDFAAQDVEATTDHWIHLSTSDGPEQNNPGGVLSAVDLRSIDLKADDGRPLSGDVLGNGDGDPACRRNLDDSIDYNTTDDTTACVAWFRL